MPEAAVHRPPRATARPLTAQESATLTAAVKTVEQTVPTLNDFLQKLLTLDAALIGGGFVVAKGDVLPYWWGVAVLTVLVVSLAACLIGLLPTRGSVNLYALGGLEAYRRWEIGIIEKKKTAMLVGGCALVLAFAVGVLGMIAKGPPAP
jgi:hypothetical protein